MNKAGKIISVSPNYAIPGGEVLINCEGLRIKDSSSFRCYFNGVQARVIGASSDRILAIVPDEISGADVEIYLENDDATSESFEITVGKLLADNLHLVANPAVDPSDDSIVVTRSGSRGQPLPITLFRIESDGFLSEMPVDVLNPTGIAFDPLGKLFVTNRADGEVYQINNGREAIPTATDLGIATGIAFDKEGNMYVGDRSENIYKISELGDKEIWATVEPSVSAFHLAFGLDENLYVTAPGLCSHDSVYQVDDEGLDHTFYKGLGRPQGLAFDDEGNLFVAACLKGRHGIVKISDNGTKAEIFVAGMSIVGLCFNRQGEMIVATSNAVYSLPVNIYGILLS